MRRAVTWPLAIAIWGGVALSPLALSRAAWADATAPSAARGAEVDGLARVVPDRGFRPAPASRPGGISTPAAFGAVQSWSIPVEPAAPGSGFDLQCVPFARELSGIQIYGDAWTWWDKAAGIFARGNRPVSGAVLSFASVLRMPNGHVAVVHKVVGPRKILIDHANWPTATVQHGAISRDIMVEDVSPANDWTEVRVQFGQGGPLGSVYPTNGFIYGWSETGTQIAKPRFVVDDGLVGPRDPRLKAFKSVSFFWALPPTDRQKAYAALGQIPAGTRPANTAQPLLASMRGQPLRLLGPGTMTISGSGLVRTTGFTQLEMGPAGGARPGPRRFVLQ